MKSLFFALGLFAIAAVAFAEEEAEVEKTQLSETGTAVLAKMRALRNEEETILEAITNEQDRAIIDSILKTEIEASDDSDEVDAAARVKRAIRRRRGRGRRANRRRAAAARRVSTTDDFLSSSY
ncbi:unnamed protein product [Strongylus vulgaris]|uniref:Uncharacterized protein n=1 Tax=Strongylus vulgaris TaxID=40348 RepID=A0A3P7J682_STRVU|nr:unnamed protein product [Strongylus vulgaris]